MPSAQSVLFDYLAKEDLCEGPYTKQAFPIVSPVSDVSPSLEVNERLPAKIHTQITKQGYHLARASNDIFHSRAADV